MAEPKAALTSLFADQQLVGAEHRDPHSAAEDVAVADLVVAPALDPDARVRPARGHIHHAVAVAVGELDRVAEESHTSRCAR